MLRVRAASAFVLLPIVIVPLLVGGVAWAVVVAAAVILATREFYRLTEGREIKASRVAGMILSACFVLAAIRPSWLLYLGVLVGGAIVILLLSAIEGSENAAQIWLTRVAGPVLIGGLLSTLVSLRQLPGGQWWTLVPLVGVWTGDAGAYLIGSRFGRRRILPKVSPGKTWAGTVAGFVLSLSGILACVAVFHQVIPDSSAGQISWRESVLVGVAVGPLALAGDLAVSVLKRRAKVKDSSNLIPGHGGMLDRCDSLLLTVPLVYLWARLVMQ